MTENLATKDARTENPRRPPNEASKIGLRKKLARWGVLVASALVFALAFPPADLAFIAWVGLIPLYVVIKRLRPWQAFRNAYIWGFVWSSASFFWIGEIEYFNQPFRNVVLAIQKFYPDFPGGLCLPYLLSFVLAFFPAFWALGTAFLNKWLFTQVGPMMKPLQEHETEFEQINPFLEVLFVLASACLWCGTEWVRTWIFHGLPWNFAGATQWRNIPVIQICDLTGVYGVSFLVALVNFSAANAGAAVMFSLRNGKYRRPFPLMFALALVMTVVIFGFRETTKFHKIMKEAPRARIGVIQGNIEQCRFANPEQEARALKTYLSYSELLLCLKPDVIVWPETAVPMPYLASYPPSVEYRTKLSALAASSKTPFLIGTIDFEEAPAYGPLGPKTYNSAFLIGPDGNIKSKYHKIHIVPFGEFVPWADCFPILAKWIGMGRGLSRGTSFEPVELAPGLRAGVNICFEDVYPYVSRKEARAGANMLLVITNDAWYPRTSEPEQHLANSVFRAVENRRPMLRCGNNGTSVLIMPDGRVTDSISTRYDDRLGKNVPDTKAREAGASVMQVPVAPNPPMTFYTMFGDIFILGCWVVFGIPLAYCVMKWRQYKLSLLDPFANPTQAKP